MPRTTTSSRTFPLTMDRVKNYNVAIKEWNDQIIFLRKVVEGGADKSYGIQVARLAGLPAEVISRARECLRTSKKRSSMNGEEPAASPTIRHRDGEGSGGSKTRSGCGG